MTKIKNYELDSTINDDDKVIGTDGLPGPNFGKTKNYSIGSLVTYVENQLAPVDGSGTLNTIPIWTPDGDTLGDSVISQSTPDDAITISGELTVQGDCDFINDVTLGSSTADTTTIKSTLVMNALVASPSYADDIAAAAGGVAIGELYRNGNIVQIRLT